MAGNQRHRDRLLLGAGAVLSLQTAAGLLPLHDTEARAWLESQGLVRYLEGRPVVCWGSVIERIAALGAPEPAEPRREAVRLPRVRL